MQVNNNNNNNNNNNTIPLSVYLCIRSIREIYLVSLCDMRR